MIAQETEGRKAFEAWVITAWEPKPCLDYADKGYVDCFVQHQYEGFEACWNTIGKELADIMQEACQVLEARRLIDPICAGHADLLNAALTKYRGTR